MHRCTSPIESLSLAWTFGAVTVGPTKNVLAKGKGHGWLVPDRTFHDELSELLRYMGLALLGEPDRESSPSIGRRYKGDSAKREPEWADPLPGRAHHQLHNAVCQKRGSLAVSFLEFSLHFIQIEDCPADDAMGD